jgi:hypothetical protein
MDDNTREVLILAITTLSTIAIAWIKMRGLRNMTPPPPQTPSLQEPPPSSGTPGV